MRRKILMGSTVVIVILIIVAVALFVRAPTQVNSPPPEELPTEGPPPNLLVIPEVPLGTLAIILACFLALVISQMKPKAKLR